MERIKRCLMRSNGFFCPVQRCFTIAKVNPERINLAMRGTTVYAHLQIIAHLHFLRCGTGVRGWTGSFFKVAYFLPICILRGAVHGVFMVLMMKMRIARSQRMSCSARKWLGSPESPGQADKCEEQWWKGRSGSRLLLRGRHSVWVPNSNPL